MGTAHARPRYCALSTAGRRWPRPPRSSPRASEPRLLATRAGGVGRRRMTAAKKGLVVELPAWAQVLEKRRGHIVRVTTLLAEWAEVMRIPSEERASWLDAGVFHD